MTAEKFWIGWLKVTMILMVLAGITLLTTYYLGYTDFIDARFDQVNQGQMLSPKELDAQKRRLIPFVGLLMIIWGSAMLHVAGHAFKERKLWAWRVLFYPVLIWFIADCSASLIYGVYFDLAVNFILFFQLVAPLLFLRNQFYPPKEGIA